MVSGLLMLSGCFNFGGSTDTPAVDEKSKIYENTVFTITIPKDWDVIEKDDFTSEVPEETQVVFRNNVKNETFTSNVAVIRDRKSVV